MTKILIRDARVIITRDSKKRILNNKSILINGRKIEKIGDLPDTDADEVIDARGKVVVPGFINTHHHLFQTLTRNLPGAQNAKLFDWLEYLYNIWQHIDEDAIELSTKVGMGELLLTGCTTTSDHLYLYPENSGNRLIDIEINSAAGMGIRFHPSRGSMSLSKDEGGLPPRGVTQDKDKILYESERVIDRYHDPGRFSMCRVVLAPCSPFSVKEEVMRDTAALARAKGVFMHTHLAETKDEELFCLKNTGQRPLEYMEKLNWTGRDVWFAHCVHLDDYEIDRLAESGSGVSHCPSSNMRLGSGIAPVRKMLDRGVNVSLAVDGSASNDSSDMLGELRMAMMCARHKTGVDSMGASDVIGMATEGGAAVLGRDDIGSIEENKAADIAIFNVDRLDFAGAGSDYAASIVFCGACHLADTVIVNGKVKVKDSKLSGIDTGELVEEANRISEKIRRKAGID